MSQNIKSNYFVAFLDILGFSNVISMPNPEVKVEKILFTVKTAIENTSAKASFKHIIFSDTLLIYIKNDESSFAAFKPLRDILFVVQQIQFECMKEGVWLRGGISHGELIETKVGDYANVYGKALIEAYKYEQQAIYPRVIVGSSVVEAVGSYSRQTFFASLLDNSHNKTNKHLVHVWNRYTDSLIDEDCLTFVDYMSSCDLWAFNVNLRLIRGGLLQKDLKVVEKFIWVKKYLQTVGPFLNLGLDGPSMGQKLAELESM